MQRDIWKTRIELEQCLREICHEREHLEFRAAVDEHEYFKLQHHGLRETVLIGCGYSSYADRWFLGLAFYFRRTLVSFWLRSVWVMMHEGVLQRKSKRSSREVSDSSKENQWLCWWNREIFYERVTFFKISQYFPLPWVYAFISYFSVSGRSILS